MKPVAILRHDVLKFTLLEECKQGHMSKGRLCASQITSLDVPALVETRPHAVGTTVVGNVGRRANAGSSVNNQIFGLLNGLGHPIALFSQHCGRIFYLLFAQFCRFSSFVTS